MRAVGFDNEKYLKLQSEKILERIRQFGGKLYLEFGGKLIDDFHASRVLPGFQPDSKIRMLMQLKEQAEIVLVINAEDIENNKFRSDIGISYDMDVLRLIDFFRGRGLYVGSVVLTRYASQPAAKAFRKKLELLGVKCYRHYTIAGYPSDITTIVSDEGYGKNEYIETERSLVVVTAPGPGSGKMATCLSQLYHEHKRGIRAGYAKYETFPVWNLPLRHPVNIAYEAATADLNDVNMIDPFHLEQYGVTTVNYNRDVEIFPVLNRLFQKIYGEEIYKSPTDMGVNMAGYCIVDDEVCRRAAEQEVIRRYYNAQCGAAVGTVSKEEVGKIELLLKQLNLDPQSRPVVLPALRKAEQTGEPAVAIQLNDGRIVTGKTGEFLGASASALLNALKMLAGIDDKEQLIAPLFIEPVQALKVNFMGSLNPRLHTDETLMALSICAVTNENARRALDKLSELNGCEFHSSVILSAIDEKTLKKLGMHLTFEPRHQTKKLYYK